MFARSAALMALLLVGEAAIRVAPQAPAPAPPPVTAPAAAGARSPRNASYAITARLDPGSRTICRQRNPDLAKHLVNPRNDTPLPPLLQRLA